MRHAAAAEAEAAGPSCAVAWVTDAADLLSMRGVLRARAWGPGACEVRM